jgi:hypothetical protein
MNTSIKSLSTTVIALEPLGNEKHINLCREGFSKFAYLLIQHKYLRNTTFSWLEFSSIIVQYADTSMKNLCIVKAMQTVKDNLNSSIVWEYKKAN